MLASFLSQWLTTEPESDAIVIDLRETWTVGPIIAVLDRIIAALERGGPRSVVAAAVGSLAKGVRSRPIAAVSWVLLPVVAVSVVYSGFASSLTTATFAVHLVAATLIALGTRSRRTLEELQETRPGRVLVAAFEPPEPPTPDSAGRVADESLEDVSSASADDPPRESVDEEK